MHLITTCGTYRAENVNISESEFQRVNLSGSSFEDVNLSRVRVHDANLSDIEITAAQIGGAKFRHISPPPGPGGKFPRQRGITFEDGMLCDSTFRNVDLSNTTFTACNIEGATLDGVLLTDLLAAYRKEKGS